VGGKYRTFRLFCHNRIPLLPLASVRLTLNPTDACESPFLSSILVQGRLTYSASLANFGIRKDPQIRQLAVFASELVVTSCSEEEEKAPELHTTT
jgi:hypothetical protein